MSSVFEISVEISRPLLQVIKPFDAASGAKDVAGFLITDGANKSPISCDNRIVERGAFGLVVENGDQCGRVEYHNARSNSRNSWLGVIRLARRGLLAHPFQFVRSMENSTASSSACFIRAAGNSASASFAMAP